jgi:hypothetical protein
MERYIYSRQRGKGNDRRDIMGNNRHQTSWWARIRLATWWREGFRPRTKRNSHDDIFKTSRQQNSTPSLRNLDSAQSKKGMWTRALIIYITRYNVTVSPNGETHLCYWSWNYCSWNGTGWESNEISSGTQGRSDFLDINQNFSCHSYIQEVP